MANKKNRPDREPDISIPFHADYGRSTYIWYLDKFTELNEYWFCNDVRYTNRQVDYYFEHNKAWVKIPTLQDYLDEAEKL